MSEKDEALHSTEYLELRKLEDSERGIGGYYYSHEKRCNGIIVAILPYKLNVHSDSKEPYRYLLRYELTPCWDVDNNIVSSITGGFEHETPEDTAVEEMREEAGYDIEKNELESLGTCYGTKSTDTVYHLYAVDLHGKERYEAEGDGSYLESQAHCFWARDIEEAMDPILFTLYHKLVTRHSSY